ncbi:MAG: alpha/beta hydrolase [Clostridia bacterium]|nr:alpha/beta hydrolase [Clostridia bacterium]
MTDFKFNESEGKDMKNHSAESMQKVFYHDTDNYIPTDDFSRCISRHTADAVVTYKQLKGEALNLCYYFPKDYNKNAKYPVFMMFHGGAWNSRCILEGQSEWSGDHLGFLARYYADKGFLAVVSTYGLLKVSGQDEERQLFDLYTDCQDAMNYVADHADAYGADLTDVTLLGESAGGHLAAAMATDSFYDNRLPVHTLILLNPITHLDDKWGNGTPRSSVRPMLAGKSKAEINRLLSPLYNITKKTPKTLLIHGSADKTVALNHSVVFHDKMMQIGNQSELHIINGAEHAFILLEYYGHMPHTSIAVKQIDDYLKRNPN